jgi:hypothetical protein
MGFLDKSNQDSGNKSICPLDYAIFYVTYGLSVIPLKPGEKVPLIKWEAYQNTPPSLDEVQKWFKDCSNNIAIVCGRVSGNLVVIDFDDKEVYEKAIKEIENDQELKDIVDNTWLVQTGKGFHIYLRVDSDKPVKSTKLPKIDIKGEGGYVVAPPSLHPSGKRYTFIRFTKTTGHEIRVVSEVQYNRLLTILEKVTNAKLTWVEVDRRPKEFELTSEQIQGIVKALEPIYKPDHRHKVILYLTGWLYTRGVSYESAEKLVKEICEHYKDEECEDRLYTLKDTYGIGRTPREEVVKANGGGLKTKNGLIEEMTEAGLPEGVITTVITDLDKLLRPSKTEEGEIPIESFDILKVYHDFQHGKAYVSTYKAVLQKEMRKVGKNVITKTVPRVKIDKIYVNDNGVIKTVSLEELENEYLNIKDLHVEVSQYPELNLPTVIYDNVKISEVYKEVLEFIKPRIDTMRPEDQIAIAVWVIASYFTPVFQYFPYLAPLKMGYNSGGSQLLTVIKRLAPRPDIIADPSPASIYRMQEDYSPTMLIDEFRDNISKDTFNLIYNILVAGYTKGIKIPRVLKKEGGESVVKFEPYGPKAVIDQSLISSQYDIASRCLFVRLQRNPFRVSDYTESMDKDLINRLYSVFLVYAPKAYSLYYNMKDSGYLGRYDQIFRPLITIARLIDQEDPSLRVEEQLKVVLDDSKAYAEALLYEGDPQKKVVRLINEFIVDSLGDFMEGKTRVLAKPWHVYENGENEVYIFVSDLRKKIAEYAMSLHQKDIAYRYNEEGRSAVSEREWERVDPELAELLNGRQFIALLKKFFPNNVKDHRDRPIFVISKEDWEKLNIKQSPSRVESAGKRESKQGQPTVTENGKKFYNPQKFNFSLLSGDSSFDSEKNIQRIESERENTKSNDKLSYNSSLQSTNNNAESGKSNPTQETLDSDSQIKSLSRENSKSGFGENSDTPGLTAKQQLIYEFLKKLSERKDSAIRLDKLSQDELKLLPELKDKGYVNFDDKYVWLTPEGYWYMEELEKQAHGGQ